MAASAADDDWWKGDKRFPLARWWITSWLLRLPDQDVPPLPEGVRLVPDKEEGQGPLQGIAAGLEALHGQADAAFVTSCDAPFLSPGRHSPTRQVARFVVGCRPHRSRRLYPLTAVLSCRCYFGYSRSARPPTAFALRVFANRVATRWITESDPDRNRPRPSITEEHQYARGV